MVVIHPELVRVACSQVVYVQLHCVVALCYVRVFVPPLAVPGRVRSILLAVVLVVEPVGLAVAVVVPVVVPTVEMVAIILAVVVIVPVDRDLMLDPVYG